jgi:hypothetical protein
MINRITMDENMHVTPHGSNTMLAAAFVSRCKRKFRQYEELKIKSSGGVFDLFDNAIKEVYQDNG